MQLRISFFLNQDNKKKPPISQDINCLSETNKNNENPLVTWPRVEDSLKSNDPISGYKFL